jgi:hypothetical protein
MQPTQKDLNKALRAKYPNVVNSTVYFKSAYVDGEIGARYRLTIYCGDCLMIERKHPLLPDNSKFRRLSTQTFKTIDDCLNSLEIDAKRDSNITY